MQQPHDTPSSTGNTKDCDCGSGLHDNGGQCLPEVNLSHFVLSLGMTAMFHLGEMPDPQTGSVITDLGLAKHTIDTLSMLKEKTEGNRTPEETKQLENLLFELRMLYVKKSN
ncbi:DUF1844 domain-containing protein [Desulfovibrio inopinatus]|uniref:DUF1844 domain-containing protein n=1 Tax=Desulfovibrio inopinatus TaxID=102109 RepID=UPI00041144FE|nr:DUF1844 domain-containing protein [Desulfovibrio inopinatus]